MSLEKINNYLQKFKILTPPHEVIRKQTQRLIEERFGITLPLEAIQVKNKRLFIQTPPIIKNEIFLQKNSLLKELQKTNPLLEDVV